MSLDHDEVKKFDALAQEWWDLDGKFAVLHKINPLRLHYIRSTIEAHYTNKLPEDLSILDIGCGGGLVSIPLAKIGYNVTAIDAAEQAVGVATNKAESLGLKNIDIQLSKGDDLPDNQYDIVVCLEVMEHVSDLDSFITQLSKRVKKNGMIICSTLNRNPKSFLLSIVAAEYILGWVPQGTHEYRRFIKPSELYHLLAANNIQVQEQKGLEYNPLKREWKMTDSTDINYFVYGSKS